MTDELMGHFLVEGRELVAAAERDLATLAKRPTDASALDSCFRAMHTLKGSVGLFDLAPMGLVLHAAEDLLTLLHADQVAPEADVQAVLAVVDQVSRWLDALERAGELPRDAPQVAAAQEQHLRTRVATRTSGGAAVEPATSTWQVPAEFCGLSGVAVRYTPHADSYFSGDDPVAILAAAPGLAALKLSPRDPWGELGDYDPYSCNLVLEAVFDADRAKIEAAFRYVADQVQMVDLAVAAPLPVGGAKTLRVEAARVDELVNLTNDLVTAKSGLSDLAAWAARLPDGQGLSEALRHQLAQIDRLVVEMHAAVGRVRLVPLSTLFDRLPRLMREIAQTLDKDVALQTSGGGVEVDKAIVDGLFEPLMHVLRNAIDHGVEPREVRNTLAKPKTAMVRLSARTASDQVIIEVADDGAGIDVQRVRALAVSRGLLSQDAVDRLDDQAATDLIFTAGLSTARTVSAVSGRGVGMDVVRDAAARLGGSVSVRSARGQGSTLRFSLPVTLSLTKIMVVACGEDRYGLALDAIVETVRVAADQIIPVRSGRAFLRRGQATPLVALSQLLDGESPEPRLVERVVIADVGGEQVGFAVDAVVDRMDVVVRPMTGLLAGARGVAGATLMPDGGVLMILNLAEVLA